MVSYSIVILICSLVIHFFSILACEDILESSIVIPSTVSWGVITTLLTIAIVYKIKPNLKYGQRMLLFSIMIGALSGVVMKFICMDKFYDNSILGSFGKKGIFENILAALTTQVTFYIAVILCAFYVRKKFGTAASKDLGNTKQDLKIDLLIIGEGLCRFLGSFVFLGLILINTIVTVIGGTTKPTIIMIPLFGLLMSLAGYLRSKREMLMHGKTEHLEKSGFTSIFFFMLFWIAILITQLMERFLD